ncbi:MAG: hypothetical protein GY854_07320 [Deltaproteobacteria bacterium]|nr:hypothetical protein [Deltaproteobacteria bacterium]
MKEIEFGDTSVDDSNYSKDELLMPAFKRRFVRTLIFITVSCLMGGCFSILMHSHYGYSYQLSEGQETDENTKRYSNGVLSIEAMPEFQFLGVSYFHFSFFVENIASETVEIAGAPSIRTCLVDY